MPSTPDPSSPCSILPSHHLGSFWSSSSLLCKAPDALAQFNNPPEYNNSLLPVETFAMEGVTATSISAFSDDIFTNNYALLSPLSTSYSSQLAPYSPSLQINHYQQQTLQTSIPPSFATSLASLTPINDKWDTLHVSHDHISWDRYTRGLSPAVRTRSRIH